MASSRRPGARLTAFPGRLYCGVPSMSSPPLTPAQERLRDLWEVHVRYEFATRNTEDTLATMVEDASIRGCRRTR